MSAFVSDLMQALEAERAKCALLAASLRKADAFVDAARDAARADMAAELAAEKQRADAHAARGEEMWRMLAAEQAKVERLTAALTPKWCDDCGTYSAGQSNTCCANPCHPPRATDGKRTP